ncbi:MAG: 50S ribosomal protein L37ae [Candidatus Aenigmarchaeota archaeon]|nr:50S ribosomal protein L37ae [Candidatus Aenigmarchaeota archaeon]
MGRTKKVGSAGRYGIRYGKGTKKRLVEIEKVQKAKHTCPNCMKPTLKREASGIWVCRKCNVKLAGRAYDVA